MNPGTPIPDLLHLMSMQFGSRSEDGGNNESSDLDELPPIPPVEVEVEVSQDQWPPLINREGEGEEEGPQRMLQASRSSSLVHRNSLRPDELEVLLPGALLSSDADIDDDSDIGEE
jgi:hypothetical protein